MVPVVDANTLPESVRSKGQRTFRSIRVDGDEVEFSEGFADLHTATYRDVLSGGGFGMAESRPAIQLVHDIRHAELRPDRGELHPFVAAARR